MTTNTEVARTSTLNETVEWAKYMASGSLIPQAYRNNPANLMYAAEYADALGVSRIHVLTSIAVINGKPTASADLMSALVRAAGHKLRITGDDTYAEASLVRSDDPDFTATARWDVAKARKAGLWGNKGPWTNYPAAMLRSRAISEVVRMAATDVMAGAIYTPEELGAQVDDEGNPITLHQTATVQRSQPQRQPTPQQTQQAQDRTQNSTQALDQALIRVQENIPDAEIVTNPNPAPTTAMNVDTDGFPAPLVTNDPDADQRLHEAIKDVKAADNNDILQAIYEDDYPKFRGEHAAALVQALNARQAALAAV